MALYVVEVDRLGDAGLLIEVFEIIPQVRVVHDATQVALEVVVVDEVEAHQGREEGPVRLGDAVAAKVAFLAEHALPVAQRVEEFGDGVLVGGLLPSKARAVNAVVDRLVEFV